MANTRKTVKDTKGKKPSRDNSPIQTQLQFATMDDNSTNTETTLTVPVPTTSANPNGLGATESLQALGATASDKNVDITTSDILNSMAASLFVPPLRPLSPTSGRKYSDLTKNALSTHTTIPAELRKKNDSIPNMPDIKDNTYTEPAPIPVERITSETLLEFHIYPFEVEPDLPNFCNGTYALYYFRVLRDVVWKWTRAKGHNKTLTDSRSSDIVPPGLKLNKNLEVIEMTASLKLAAMKILGKAEGQLCNAIIAHYDDLIPKLEDEFKSIYNNMTGVTQDEQRLIALKLIHYKNTLMRAQREKMEAKQRKFATKEAAPKNDPTTSNDTTDFPWAQLNQRQPGEGARGRRRGRNNARRN